MSARHGSTAINANRFRWTGGNGYAEASELRDLQLHQVYDDACDEGFTVEAQRFSVLKTFVQTHVNRDREHELQSTVYSSVNMKTGRVDKPGVMLTITIFND